MVNPQENLIVVMEPITNENQAQVKRYKSIKYRPFPESAVRQMGQWVQSQTWYEIYKLDDVNQKSEKFEEMIMAQVNLLFPEKTIKLSENDKPWVATKLKKLDDQWVRINKAFL